MYYLVFDNSFIYITFSTAEEHARTEEEITYNEQCTLQNQVRYIHNTYQNKYDLLFV